MGAGEGFGGGGDFGGGAPGVAAGGGVDVLWVEIRDDPGPWVRTKA